jgi:3-oxoacyl-[acyl-carrier protein] reductase
MSTTSTPSRRVALVTGGSRGIGRESALRLADDGAAIAICHRRDAAAAASVVAEIEAGGGEAFARSADVADHDAVEAVFAEATSRFGGVDVVVHAAGIMPLSPLADLDLDVLDRVIATNLRGTFVVGQQAVRQLRPGGTIVTFSSSVLGLALPGYSAYAATKGGVEAITLILARELRGRDVTVNAIAPGPTATELFLDGKDDATVERFASQPPLERLGRPADIAELVAFLAGPGHWVNGQVIRINGGLV